MFKYILPLIFCISSHAFSFGPREDLENRSKPKISSEQRAKFESLIETEVDPMFQKMAKAFLQNNPILDVRSYKNRLVFDVDTRRMYVQLTDVYNDREFNHEESLKDVTSIPFPRPGDIKANGDFTYDFSMIRIEFDLGLGAYEKQDGKELLLYFMKMEWGSLLFSFFAPEASAHIAMLIRDSGETTFNTKGLLIVDPNSQNYLKSKKLFYY